MFRYINKYACTHNTTSEWMDIGNLYKEYRTECVDCITTLLTADTVGTATSFKGPNTFLDVIITVKILNRLNK